MSVPAFSWRQQLVVGFMFLTRLPVPALRHWPADAVARAAWCFPVVGAVIGLMGGLAGLAALRLGLPDAAAALLVLLATLLVTGALHEDGLADSADGLFGGRDSAQKLAIMKDSRIGSYGALALILSVGLRGAALAALVPWPGRLVLALVVAHAVSRAGLALMMRHLPPARPGGLGASVGLPGRNTAAMAAGLGGLIAAGLLGGRDGLLMVLLTFAAMLSVALFARRAIGGYTGDVLGAAQQIAEITVLLALAR